MKTIRWAVIGAGGIARRRTIPEGIVPAHNAELTAVYSPHSGQEVAREFGVVAAETEAQLYNLAWDALYVASPVNCHLAQVVQAAKAGRHVLCEKPLALNVAEAQQMVDGCHQANVKFGVGFMMRGHPLHVQARELVQAERIGQPSYVRAQLSCWYPPLEGAWRQDPEQSGGGALPDLATHCIDLLEMILGQKVLSVMAVLDNVVHDYAVDDTAVLSLKFDGGTVGTVDCLFNVPDEAVPNRLEVYGAAGSILAEGTLGQTATGNMKWLEQTSDSDYDEGQTRCEQNAWQSAEMETKNLYQTQIEGFSAAILRDQPPPVPATQGLWIQQLMAACQESASTGRRVCVDSTSGV